MSGKIPDDRGFHCFPTVPDFAEILGNCQTSVLDLRFSLVTDAFFFRMKWGTGVKQFRGFGNELKLSLTSPTVPI